MATGKSISSSNGKGKVSSSASPKSIILGVDHNMGQQYSEDVTTTREQVPLLNDGLETLEAVVNTRTYYGSGKAPSRPRVVETTQITLTTVVNKSFEQDGRGEGMPDIDERFSAESFDPPPSPYDLECLRILVQTKWDEARRQKAERMRQEQECRHVQGQLMLSQFFPSKVASSTNVAASAAPSTHSANVAVASAPPTTLSSSPNATGSTSSGHTTNVVAAAPNPPTTSVQHVSSCRRLPLSELLGPRPRPLLDLTEDL